MLAASLRGSLFALAFGLASCAPAAPRPGGAGADVELPVVWQARGGLQGQSSFTLDAPAGAGSSLLLDGAWWRVELTLDGAALPPVAPGLGPAEVPLPRLEAGTHKLEITVRAPGAEPPVVSLPNKNRTLQGGLVTLRLQDSRALGAVALALDAGTLTPTIALHSPPEGATVELTLSLDGETVAHWPAQSVNSALAPQRWTATVWGIGRPALYVATATLRDRGGGVLASRSTRVGPRESALEDGVLHLNGERAPLLALRGQPTQSPSVVAAEVAQAGLGAVELHGAIASRAWYEPFDEWGLPLVQVARCDGRLWAPGVNAQSVLQQSAGVLAEQDTRLLAASGARPALLAWVCEGSEHLRATACAGLKQDPMARPVFGVDVPAVSISGTYAPPPTGPTWVIELGHPHGGALPAPSVTASTFVAALGAQGSGGAVPGAEGGDAAAWSAAWRQAAVKLGAKPWTAERRRAASSVRVTGLQPGEIVTLSAPGLAPVGAAADALGTARFGVWYAGPATLRWSAGRREVALRSDAWMGTQREGLVNEVNVAAL